MRKWVGWFVLFMVTSGPAAAQVSTQNCALTVEPGVSEQQLVSGGMARSFRLYVPEAVGPLLPLVLDLHGSGGTAAGQAANSRLEAVAEREGFAVATLQADSSTGNRWNVPVTADRPDDVAYVADVIDALAGSACIDTTRVYATGFSGGARMASVLACQLNDRIAAIAPMAGLRWPGPCEGQAVPVLSFHGLADPQNTYDGGVEGRGGEWGESVPDALAGWASHNSCGSDVIFEDPDGPISILRYSGCRSGIDVRLVRIDGLRHQWARDEVDASQDMWTFFSSYKLGEAGQ